MGDGHHAGHHAEEVQLERDHPDRRTYGRAHDSMGPGRALSGRGRVHPGRFANLHPQLTGAAAACTASLLLRHGDRLKPHVGVMLKEIHSFKEWLLHKAEELREDVEDVQAEAKASYVQDVALHLQALEREKALVERVADLMARRSEAKP